MLGILINPNKREDFKVKLESDSITLNSIFLMNKGRLNF